MPDCVPVDGGLALSDYEAKLVVAALCRYARVGDVHAAHRDRCERLASALAGESSVTLTLSPGAPGADGDHDGGKSGAGAVAGRTTRDGSAVRETAAAEVASDPSVAVADAGEAAAAEVAPAESAARGAPTDADGPTPATADVGADADATRPAAAESPTDADGTGRETTGAPPETAGETAFRWGPDRADG